MIRIVNTETRTMILTNVKAAFAHTSVNLIEKFSSSIMASLLRECLTAHESNIV